MDEGFGGKHFYNADAVIFCNDEGGWMANAQPPDLMANRAKPKGKPAGGSRARRGSNPFPGGSFLSVFLGDFTEFLYLKTNW